MSRRFWRLVLASGAVVLLAGCGNRQTQEALQKASDLDSRKQYQDANEVLVEGLRAREAVLRSQNTPPTDPVAAADYAKKLQADPEILKLERAQLPLYIHMERADLASAIYSDILAGHPGDTVVLDLLHSPDKTIRIGAIRVCGLAAKPDAIAALATATKDPDQEVRRAAVVALGSIKGPETVPPLIEALGDSYWDVRSEAANALGQDHDVRAVKPLILAVADPDPTVVSSAETALLFLCKEPNLRADDFAARLNDSNPKLLRISAVCLALLRDPRAVPVLLKLVDSPDPVTRLDAIKGLGESGDRSVIPTLRATLKDPEVNVRGWSIIGLGKMRDFGSLDDLRAIANNPAEPPSIRSAAAGAANHISPSNQDAPSAGP